MSFDDVADVLFALPMWAFMLVMLLGCMFIIGIGLALEALLHEKVEPHWDQVCVHQATSTTIMSDGKVGTTMYCARWDSVYHVPQHPDSSR